MVTVPWRARYLLSPLTLILCAIPTHAFVFVHITDTHLSASGAGSFGTRGQESLRDFAAMLPVIKPQFVVATGDIADAGDEASWRLFLEILKGAPCPVYPVAGNHDWPPVEVWRSVFQTQHIVADCEDCTLIGIGDSSGCAGERNWPQWGDYLEEQLKLAHGRGQRQFLIAMHHPLVAMPNPTFDSMPGWASLGGEQALRVINLCAQYHVKAHLAGHLHPIYDCYNSPGGVLSLAGPALGTSPNGPPGQFRLLSLEDGALCWTEAVPGQWPAIAVIAPERNAQYSPVAAQDGLAKVIVKPFSPDPITTVTCAAPGKEPVAMTPCGEGRYETRLAVGNTGLTWATLTLNATDARARTTAIKYPVLVRPVKQ
ncbi:metallophosphoesterase [bacterium]|nr:metallophosphoesterase [bacterium]